MVVFWRLLSNWYAFIKDAPICCLATFLSLLHLPIFRLCFQSILVHHRLDNNFDLLFSTWLKIRIAIMILIIWCLMQLRPRLTLLYISLLSRLSLTNQLRRRLGQHLLHTITPSPILSFYFAIDDHLFSHNNLRTTLHLFLTVYLTWILEIIGVVTTDCGGTIIYEGASIRDFLASSQLSLPRQCRGHLHLRVSS